MSRRAIVALLAGGVIFLAGTMPADAAYRYFGLKIGRTAARVRLDSVKLPTEMGHAAVWLGVNSPDNSHWVQGGIEQQGTDLTPSAYIEIGKGGTAERFESWPVGFGQVVKVKLVRWLGMWHVVVKWKDHWHRSKAIVVPHAVIQETLETEGLVFAVAHINGHKIIGNTLG